MSILKSISTFFVTVIAFQSGSACALVDAATLPVVTLEQDYNGVDVSSGGYATKSRFHLASPAASKLGIKTTFNGRGFGFSLNTYFKDETYTVYGFHPTTRQLTVVFEGRSFFFSCADIGECTDLNYLRDGSQLTRLSARTPYSNSGEDQYRFTYRDGTVVNFFDPRYEGVPPCTEDDSGCNAALYRAYAYASNIKYPTGEKLTYDALSTGEYDEDGVFRSSVSIRSNLGYSLKFATKWPSNDPLPTKAGIFWTRQILSEDLDIKITLRENNLDLLGVQGKREYHTVAIEGTDSTSKALKKFEEIDFIGRVTSWEFTTRWATTCNIGNLDLMSTMITKETSPGGVVTAIEYNDYLGLPFKAFQVKSVKRGGRTWHYTYDESGRTGITSTDAYGGKRTSNPSIWLNPLPQPHGGCPIPIPGKPTKYTDELDRVTDVRLDNNSSEIAEITYPAGNGYIYVRDPRSNIVEALAKPTNGGSTLIVYKADFPSSCENHLICNQPNWVEDGKGNRTNFTYYPDHGGIKTKTLAPNNDGVYAREFYFYEALNTDDGTIYRLARVETCGLVAAKLSETSCPANSETKVQSKTYWNKTFLPESITLSDGLGHSSMVTTFTYNKLGLVTSEDGPRIDVDDISYRTYDAVGRLIFEISPHPGDSCQSSNQACRVRKITKHYYNNDDQETRTEIGGGSAIDGSDFVWSSAKKMTYDIAGLLVKIEEIVP